MSPLDFLIWTGLIAVALIVYAAIVLIFVAVLQGINSPAQAGKLREQLDQAEIDRDTAKSSLVRLQAILGALANDAAERGDLPSSWLVSPDEIREAIERSAQADAEGAALEDLGYIPADTSAYYIEPVTPGATA